MKSKLIIISFTLFFFNSAQAICVKRNSSTPSPSPDTPPNLKPVSSSPSSSPKAPTPSPASKSPSPSSSPRAPTPPSPASKSPSPSSSPRAPTPPSPASKSPSPSSSPKAPTPSYPASKSPSPSSSPEAPTPSSPASKSPSLSSSPKAPAPSSPPPKALSPQQSPSSASISDSSPSKTDSSLLKQPILNTITSAIPKLGGGGDNPAIQKICGSTDYPDVCLTTLGPLAGPANDVSAVLGVAIKAGSNFAKTALDTAEKLASKPGMPPDEASSIKDCRDSFDDVSYNFQNAADALPKKDVGTMNTMLSAALTDVGDCQDAFEGQISPLATISDTLRKMASNCLAIVEQMNK